MKGELRRAQMQPVQVGRSELQVLGAVTTLSVVINSQMVDVELYVVHTNTSHLVH